jgi:hypothetical protein
LTSSRRAQANCRRRTVERSTRRWTNGAPFFQSGIPELANGVPVHVDPLFNM